jgi:hypothetical protein
MLSLLLDASRWGDTSNVIPMALLAKLATSPSLRYLNGYIAIGRGDQLVQTKAITSPANLTPPFTGMIAYSPDQIPTCLCEVCGSIFRLLHNCLINGRASLSWPQYGMRRAGGK